MDHLLSLQCVQLFNVASPYNERSQDFDSLNDEVQLNVFIPRMEKSSGETKNEEGDPKEFIDSGI